MFKYVVVVQSSSLDLNYSRPHGLCSMRGFPVITSSQNLPKSMSTESVMPSNHLIFCHPLLLPSTFPCIRVFSNESAVHIKWPEYWSVSFSISPSNEYSGLICFKIDSFDLCCPRDSQESSPTPQFRSINSLALCPLYGPYYV